MAFILENIEEVGSLRGGQVGKEVKAGKPNSGRTGRVSIGRFQGGQRAGEGVQTAVPSAGTENAKRGTITGETTPHSGYGYENWKARP